MPVWEAATENYQNEIMAPLFLPKPNQRLPVLMLKIKALEQSSKQLWM